MSRRLWAACSLLCAAFALAGCGDIGRFQTSSPIASPAKPPTRTVAQTTAAEREYERILSSYGGAYDDPKLEALIGKTVDRLVAASDRPDQAYKVTILNSGAVNAFALPTGQLYVTRGLIALASDTSELSSVLSHEMAHVLAKHASIPDDQARVQNAEASARQYSSPEGGDRDQEPYLQAIDTIVYGEDPSEGFVRGRRFLHPKLGFTFAAPETFTLDNTAQAVIGVREGGTQAMRFDVVRVPAEQTLGEYLNSGWMEGVDKASTEDLTINGFPAASATAHGDQWQFKVYALRFGSDVYRFIFAAKQRSIESDRNARETVNSFRRLTLEEIQAARPLRIKVITVQPGDTVESLSHRMTGVDRPAERFRILNGLDVHAQVKVRDLVKIVVD